MANYPPKTPKENFLENLLNNIREFVEGDTGVEVENIKIIRFGSTRMDGIQKSEIGHLLLELK